MKKFRMTILALVGILAMPMIAAGSDVTTVGFSQKTNPSIAGNDYIEFTVTKGGPAEVLVLWATSRGQLFLHGGGVKAEAGKDFTPMAGQLFFRAEDTAISFRVPITRQTNPVTIEEGRSKDFIVGLAINPFHDHDGHAVEFREGGFEYALGQIRPCFLLDFNITGMC